jgi:hypothetical protein
MRTLHSSGVSPVAPRAGVPGAAGFVPFPAAPRGPLPLHWLALSTVVPAAALGALSAWLPGLFWLGAAWITLCLALAWRHDHRADTEGAP